MRRAHIGVVLALVIVVAAGSDQALGGGYLIRNAALVLTMDPQPRRPGASSDSSRTPTCSSRMTKLRRWG